MAVVTGIVPSARKPGRFDVMVDGRHAATVSLDTIERLALTTGAAYEAVRADVERDAALLATYDRGLNMLALRARSSRELRRQLVRKGEPADRVDAAIQRLVAAGLVDDGAFARQFARSKVLGTGMSRRRIEEELGRRGVAREVGGDAVAAVFEEEAVDEAMVVEQVARKKLRSLVKLDRATRTRRLYAFLARRGYDSDKIRQAIEAVTNEDLDDSALDQ